MSTQSFDRIPSTLPLFARLALSKGSKDKTLAEPLVAEAKGIVSGRNAVRRYVQVCGGEEGQSLPILYPQVVANPLVMHLFTHPRFPLAALGLVHVENEIQQQRAPRVGEKLDYKVTIPTIERTPRGYEFETLIDVSSEEGELIWQARGRILSRAKDPNAPASSAAPRSAPQPSEWPLIRTFALDAAQGRRYARVSGDYNPIHLTAPTARALGFKKAIIHGMWSAAATAATLKVGDGPCRLAMEFKTPLFLPGKANLHARTASEGTQFVLQDARSFRPILSGVYSVEA